MDSARRFALLALALGAIAVVCWVTVHDARDQVAANDGVALVERQERSSVEGPSQRQSPAEAPVPSTGPDLERIASSSRSLPGFTAGNVTISIPPRPCVERTPPRVGIRALAESAGPSRPFLSRFTHGGDTWTWRLPAGSWQLEVDGDGWVAATEVTRIEDADGSVTWSVEPRPANELAGLVVDAATGAGLPSFELQAQVERTSTFGPEFVLLSPQRVEHPEGRFCLCAVPGSGGRIRLVASALRYERAETDWFDNTSGTSLRDLVLALRALAESRQLVSGRVTSAEDGAGIPGATVRALEATRAASELWVAGGSLVDPSFASIDPSALDPEATLTDERGEYRLQSAKAGDVRLLAFHPEYQLMSGERVHFSPGGAPLTIDLRLKRGAIIEGVVIADEPVLSRMRPVSVEVRGPDIERSVRLDEGLRFRVPGLIAGEYELTVQAEVKTSARSRAPAFVARRRVMLRESSTERVEISMLPGATGCTVRGRVLLPREVAFERGMIGALQSSIESPDEAAPLDAEGAFELPNVPRGRGWICASGRSADDSRWFVSWQALEFGAPGTSQTMTLRGDAPAIEIRSAKHALDPALARGVALSSDDPFATGFLEKACHARMAKDGTVAWFGLPAGHYSAHVEGLENPVAFTIELGDTSSRVLEAH